MTLCRRSVGVVLATVAIAASVACAARPSAGNDAAAPAAEVTTPPVPSSAPLVSGPGSEVQIVFPTRLAVGEGTATVNAVACQGIRGQWTGTLTLNKMSTGPSRRARDISWTFDAANSVTVTVGHFDDYLGSGPHSAWLVLDLRLVEPNGPHQSIVLDDVTTVEQGFPDESLSDHGGTGLGVPNRISTGTVPGCPPAAVM